jgi:hypothetical protein
MNRTTGTGTEDPMDDAYECVELEEWPMVRRVGVARLAEAMLHVRGDVTLARHRGSTMKELAKALANGRVNADIAVAEPDGAAWSISVTSSASGGTTAARQG